MQLFMIVACIVRNLQVLGFYDMAWYDRAAMAAAAERAARSLRLQKEGSSSASGIQNKVSFENVLLLIFPLPACHLIYNSYSIIESSDCINILFTPAGRKQCGRLSESNSGSGNEQ